MTAETPGPPRTLSIRRWLALALISIVLVPVMSMVVIGFIVFAPTDGPFQLDREIREVLRENPGRWSDPAWQQQLIADYGDDADIVLTVDREEIFRTGDPLATGAERTVQPVTIPDAVPAQVAYVYTDTLDGPPEELRLLVIPATLIMVLILTLAAIAWFLRRSIIQPLEATSDAARKVARGDLDINLPPSRVREVAALNEAFQSMSDDLRRSLARRTAMEREREMFVTAIAHDLRTPLFSLRGSIQGLQQGIASSPEQRSRYLTIAMDKADQLEHLIADLFTFTRIEYMGDSPSREALDLPVFLQELVESTRPQAGEKAIVLSLDEPVSGAAIKVHADAHLMTRAIENILGNALRHTPDGGTIGISWEATPGDVTITIVDSGPGFAEEDLPHLFEPLYRGESSRNRATGGAGLGLTIAQRIVVAHGGTLTASNAPSGGAQLTITLPQ